MLMPHASVTWPEHTRIRSFRDVSSPRPHGQSFPSPPHSYTGQTFVEDIVSYYIVSGQIIDTSFLKDVQGTCTTRKP